MPTIIDRIAFPLRTVNKPAPPPANVKRVQINEHGIDYLYYALYSPHRVVRSVSTSLVSSNTCISEPPSYISTDGHGLSMAYFHSNAESLVTIQGSLQRLSNATGCKIYSFEYPGYGIASYERTTSEVYCELVVRHIARRFHFNLIWGRSLGGYFAAYLASLMVAHADSSLVGLILESAVSSAFQAISGVRWFGCANCIWFKDEFKTYSLMANLGAINVLVLHGENDDIIPLKCAFTNFSALCNSQVTDEQLSKIDQAREFRAGNKRLAILDGARHNDLSCMQRAWTTAIEEFLVQCVGDPTFRIDMDALIWAQDAGDTNENCIL